MADTKKDVRTMAGQVRNSAVQTADSLYPTKGGNTGHTIKKADRGGDLRTRGGSRE